MTYREQFENETDSYPYVENDYTEWIETKLKKRDKEIIVLQQKLKVVGIELAHEKTKDSTLRFKE